MPDEMIIYFQYGVPEIADPKGSMYLDYNGSAKYHSGAKYKALEARIDELLEQQRMACVDAYENIMGGEEHYRSDVEEAIDNARIDK